MTGIFCYHAKNGSRVPGDIDKLASKISHRGRFSSRVFKDGATYMKIFVNKPQRDNIDIVSPLVKGMDGSFVALDGEILNGIELRYNLHENLMNKHNVATLVLHGFQRWGHDSFSNLSGPFSLVMRCDGKLVAAKDPVGFNPLYVLENDDAIVFSSELKVASKFNGDVSILEPGHALVHENEHSTIKTFFNPEMLATRGVKSRERPVDVEACKRKLHGLLNDAVQRAIKPGCKNASLLSGGIDSAIICALATQYLAELDVYTVAFEGSEDLKYARLFVDRFEHDIRHHVFKITVDDMLDILPNVIYNLETFDAALIRSAVPMHYLCSKIQDDVDVLLTGEGGDELFGGYSYLKDLSPQALDQELVELLRVEHATGLQRVDRIPYWFGIEARAPWFDFDIVKFAFEVPLDLKIHHDGGEVIDKWIERETFKDAIPAEIACRPKAKFSEGVGTEFILRDHFNETITDDEFEREREVISGVEVKSKEELYYWRIFEDAFNPSADFVRRMARTGNFEV